MRVEVNQQNDKFGLMPTETTEFFGGDGGGGGGGGVSIGYDRCVAGYTVAGALAGGYALEALGARFGLGTPGYRVGAAAGGFVGHEVGQAVCPRDNDNH
jgi:hypothetical protein